MRKIILGTLSLAIFAVVFFCWSSPAAKGAAQQAAPAQDGAARGGGGRGKSATAGEPYDTHDLSHVWGGQSTGNRTRTLTTAEPPMNAAGLAFYHAQKTEFSDPPIDGPENTDPILRCEPGSAPRTYPLTHPIQIVQTPSVTVMLLEAYRNFRIIYTDGRKLPDHPEGTWYGDSVGHWDGDSFVIDSANFNGRSWLDDVGHPMSDKTQLQETLTRADHDHMNMDIIVNDPTYYTQPFGGRITWQLRPDSWELEDYLCSPADEAKMNTLVRDKADEDPNAKKVSKK